MSETVQDSFTERELRKLLSTRGSVRRGLISKRQNDIHTPRNVPFCLVRLLSNLVYILNIKPAEIQMALICTISWNVEVFVEFHFWCRQICAKLFLLITLASFLTRTIYKVG